jgi:hypothetical protein
MLNQLLFNIPTPMKWTTGQVANIIGLISAAATVAALWYAFYRNRKQDKKINDLAEITQKLAQQNGLLLEQNQLQKLSMKEEVRPDFVKGGASYGNSGELTFSIRNNGYRAIVNKIDYNEDEVLFQKKSTPLVVTTNKELQFKCSIKGEKYIVNCNWGIFIHFTDIYKNPYLLTIYGTGLEIYSFELTC